MNSIRARLIGAMKRATRLRAGVTHQLPNAGRDVCLRPVGMSRANAGRENVTRLLPQGARLTEPLFHRHCSQALDLMCQRGVH